MVDVRVRVGRLAATRALFYDPRARAPRRQGLLDGLGGQLGDDDALAYALPRMSLHVFSSESKDGLAAAAPLLDTLSATVTEIARCVRTRHRGSTVCFPILNSTQQFDCILRHQHRFTRPQPAVSTRQLHPHVTLNTVPLGCFADDLYRRFGVPFPPLKPQ